MRWFTRCARGLVLACVLLALPAWAETPDPVEFGLVVERGDFRTVKRWLDEGLDPEFQADRIGTGLMIAAWNGNVEMMALFVERGANPRRANRHGEQPLQLAAWGGHEAAVAWLLEQGATLNRDGANWGALHYAVFNGHDKLARSLIARGADVNARSPNGSTALMLAAREGREDLARVMLESGADTKAKNDWGDNALTLAMRYDHYRLGKMIASPEEFEIAIKAPRESFGEPVRSVAAPSEIEDILRRMREAEAAGLPTVELRSQLLSAVASFRRSAAPQPQNARRPAPRPFMPRSIVITAKRGRAGGERAEVLVDGRPQAPAQARVQQAAPARPGVSPAQIADLLRQIRAAEAQGLPTEAFRRQLDEAMSQLR